MLDKIYVFDVEDKAEQEVYGLIEKNIRPLPKKMTVHLIRNLGINIINSIRLG